MQAARWIAHLEELITEFEGGRDLHQAMMDLHRRTGLSVCCDWNGCGAPMRERGERDERGEMRVERREDEREERREEEREEKGERLGWPTRSAPPR